MRKSTAAAFVALVLVAAMALAGCKIKAPTSNLVTGGTVADRAGISVGIDLLWESDAKRNADLDAVKQAGATWIAIDVDWKSIQGDGPFSDRWDRGLDATVIAARLHGLKILADITYSPPWARGADCPAFEADSGHCFPVDPKAYGVFAGAAAQRYGANSTNPMLRGSIFTSSDSGSCKRRAIDSAPRTVTSRSGCSSRASFDAEYTDAPASRATAKHPSRSSA